MCLYGSASCLTSIGMNRRVVRRLKAALPRVKRQPVGLGERGVVEVSRVLG
jgi:plasmid replication initiation protein